MNNYNIILEYIDEINDSVVTTESNVIKSLMNSYYKQYELFTECEYLGKDPYKIYQEASIMDEVKEKSSKDKNKLISIVKLVPRLIIALINKIKNKLFKKGNNITNVDKQAIEETRKAVSNSKTGKIVLGGGVIVTALGAGGLVISKVIKNKGKSSTKVEVEITKDNKVKCDFDIKAIKELVKALVGDMKKVMEQCKDSNVQKVSESMVNNITKNTEKLNDELKKENKNGDKVEVKSGDFNIESIVADLQYVKDNMGALRIWEKDEALVKYIERLPAAVNAVETAINKFADLNSIVRSLKKQQSSDKNKNKNNNDGVSVETKTRNKEKLKTPEKHNNQEQESSTEDLSTRNNINTLKKFIGKINSNIGGIKDILTGDQYNRVQEAVNDANDYVSREGDLPSEVLGKIKKICDEIYENIYKPILQYEDFEIPDENNRSERGKVSNFLIGIGFKKTNIKLGDAQPNNIRDYFRNVSYDAHSENKYLPDTISGAKGHPYVINTSDIGGIVNDKNKAIDTNFYLRGYTVKIAKMSGTTENVNDDAKNLKKFVDTVKNKLPDIKSTIDEEDYDGISKAINKSYKILEGLTNDKSKENLGKEHEILYNIHSAINSVCKETRAFRYEMDRAAKLFKQSEGAKVIEKFLVDVGYRKMTDEFKVGDDLKRVYNKALGEWFESIEHCDNLLANDWKVNVKPNQIAKIFRYPYILDMDKLKLGDSAKKEFKMYRDQGMFIIKGFRIFERVEG